MPLTHACFVCGSHRLALLPGVSRRRAAQLEEVDFNDSIMMLAFPDGLHQTLLSYGNFDIGFEPLVRVAQLCDLLYLVPMPIGC